MLFVMIRNLMLYAMLFHHLVTRALLHVHLNSFERWQWGRKGRKKNGVEYFPEYSIVRAQKFYLGLTVQTQTFSVCLIL